MINEIGVVSRQQKGGHAQKQNKSEQTEAPLMPAPSNRKFPRKQIPDTEVVEPRIKFGGRSY